ncbi:DUF3231 family protein [Paenibacillus sp.]|uniref:DUF3231 family protein n=1 Tax=Paenibacillus sp. TaxID=58172 RepID=UPI0028127EAB|nr:DUF3231 family protein [Paenibacillus sp.]
MTIHLETKLRTEPPIENSARLTSAEVANLWTQYTNDTLAICFITHSLANAKDQEVRAILEFALELSRTHVGKVKEFLSREGYAVPKGFTEEDIINASAPALFSDDFLLNYFYVMGLLGLTSYAGALSTSARRDQREYFTLCQAETAELFNRIVDALVGKGLYVRPAILHAAQPVDFVEKQSYLNGWFGKERPLNAIEVSSVFYNMVKIELKTVLEMAFSQVVQSDEVRNYMQRGVKLCQEQFMALEKRLAEDDLPPPRKWESEVTSSTTPPFSDKLMLFHVVTLISASAAFYGAGLSVSQRRDIAVQYAKLIAEMGLLAEDGVNLLIRMGWMEQPPGAIDRDALLEKK